MNERFSPRQPANEAIEDLQSNGEFAAMGRVTRGENDDMSQREPVRIPMREKTR